MQMPMQWKRNPKPDPAVVKLTQAVAEASSDGQLRVVAIVTINPNLEVEFDCAGQIDDVRKTLLIGGLTRLIQKINA